MRNVIPMPCTEWPGDATRAITCSLQTEEEGERERENAKKQEGEIGNGAEEKIDDCRSTGYERPIFIKHIQ